LRGVFAGQAIYTFQLKEQDIFDQDVGVVVANGVVL
jgi:hypothetical protein